MIMLLILKLIVITYQVGYAVETEVFDHYHVKHIM